MTIFGVTPQGFVLKRLNDIQSDLSTALSTVTDPISGQGLTVDLADENDPLTQVINAFADSLSECWEQLQSCYNNYNPLAATGNGQSGLVQLNGITRQLNQTDSSLRATQQAATMASSSSMIESIASALLLRPGVTFSRVYQNITAGTDARGLPGKSIAAVVSGGVTQDILNTLFIQSPAGAILYGTTTGVYTDNLGQTYPVAYSAPAQVPIYITVNLNVINRNQFPLDAVEQIQTTIVNYADNGASAIGISNGFNQLGFIPGYSVENSELYLPANIVTGAQISSIFVGTIANPTTTAATMLFNQQAQVTAGNINVVVTGD